MYSANQQFIPIPSEPAIEAHAIDFRHLKATQVAAIHGPNTDLGELHNIAADDAGDVYVANTGHITEYAARADGDAGPIIDITDGILSPGYGEARYPVAVAVGPDGSIYAVVQPTRIGPSGAILVFPPGSNGSQAPLSRIIVFDSLLESPLGIAVDKAGYIYAANQGSGITVYAPGTNDNPAPVRQITGQGAYGSGEDDVLGVAVDDAGRVYATTPSNQILVYAPNANGNATPIAIISGNRTGLVNPQQLVVR